MRPSSKFLGLSLSIALVAVLAASCSAPSSAPPVEEVETGGPWMDVFNGQDLTGLEIAARGRRGAPPPDPDAPAGWHVEDGVLIGGQANPGERSGSLRTVDSYMDFELELEFALAEQGTDCSEELGSEEENTSADHACLYNSGISYRSGYQFNLGRREAGEYIGLVIHREDPAAIRGNILWLSHGDRDFPGLHKKADWNTLRLVVEGDHMQAFLNGTQITDVNDTSTLESETAWREPQPISFQSPYVQEVVDGYVKYRNIRIRTP